MTKKASLKRSITLFPLVLFGVGTILGAGIYALTGKIAGEAGIYAPLSFVIAAILAAFTALSYGELSARYPKSSGEVVYTQKALNKRSISILIGILIVFTGIVSSATLTNAFSGYLKEFIQIPDWQTILIITISFGLIAIWGINESMIAAGIITLIEIGGLILVIIVAGDSFFEGISNWQTLIPTTSLKNWSGIFLGAFLAFYAFIGFEDMVNVAEEVKKPKRNLPLAIILSIAIATIFYIVISMIAVFSLPIEQLAGSEAPLSLIVSQKGANYGTILSLISLIAISNGVLIQIIMASRVLYGMANQNMIPKIFSRINSKTKTPIIATILVISLIILFALWLPLKDLANATSFIILCVFVLVNLSLWVVKVKKAHPKNVPNYPLAIPVLGFILSLVALIIKTALVFY